MYFVTPKMRKVISFICHIPTSISIKQKNSHGISTMKLFAKDTLDFGRNDFSETLTRSMPLKLEVANSHPLDRTIDFYGGNHSYFINKSEARYSVTKYVGKYFENFVPEKVVQKMITGSNWPREGYITEEGIPFTEQQILDQ